MQLRKRCQSFVHYAIPTELFPIAEPLSSRSLLAECPAEQTERLQGKSSKSNYETFAAALMQPSIGKSKSPAFTRRPAGAFSHTVTYWVS
eukprot:5698996-Amphidinium_carterae.2